MLSEMSRFGDDLAMGICFTNSVIFSRSLLAKHVQIEIARDNNMRYAGING